MACERWRCWIPLAAAIATGACLGPASNDCASGAVCPVGLRCTADGSMQLCVLPTCGNGHLDRGEACDDGNNLSGDGCPADCRPPCGDGHLDPGEACDDGNTVGGDGCSADCRSVEACTSSDPSTCGDTGGDCSGGHCANQPGRWSAIYTEPAAGPAAMAYDAAHSRVVLFRGIGSDGDSETWEWDGASWQPRTPATLPPPRSEPAVVYDAARQRVVMYGGGGTTDNAVWEWDGNIWTALRPDASPPLLSGHAMAYDAGRHRVVLFGGMTRDGAVQDRTWEWDGTAWQDVLPPIRPTARTGHAMAYDSKRGKVVLFGGAGDGGVLAPGEVWEFDGATWTEHATATGPAATVHAAMVYNALRGGVELFGGDDAGDDPAAPIWEWGGTQWARIVGGGAVESRSSPGMAYDILRNQVVVFGGRRPRAGGLGDLGDTWEWDGGAWRDRGAVSASPGALQDAGMAYDPTQDVEIVFGGERVDDAALRAGVGLNNRTWRWDEFGWQQEVNVVPIRPDPSPRAAFAIASGEAHVLMFGGTGPGGQLLDETWAWEVIWDNIALFDPPGSAPPPPRSFAAMAYDASRRQFVLFGGAGSDGVLSDTWERREFELTGWHAKSPAHRPPARRGHAMAYDSVRKRVVLFGGAGDNLLGDTWEWDGTDWTQRTPATGPSPRSGAAMAYDTGRGRLVLFGGTDGSQILDETWEWDGAIWQQRTPTHQVPPARRAHAMVFDALRGHVVMFGGVHDDTAVPVGLLDDVWEWDGMDWRNISSTRKLPPPRSGHVMSYDLVDDITVMSSGVDRDAGRLLADSWEWNGAQWFRSEDLSPGRIGHAFVWPVLFGGQDSLTSIDLLNDTWSWFHGWDKEHPFLRPPPRFGHAMARDTTGAVMLIGGTGYEGLLSDQWATSALGWTQVTLATVPAKRTGSVAVYDASRKRLVLFGGQGESSLLGDVWEWDGTTWSNHTPETVFVPTPRIGHTLVYDDKRKRVVLFGGRSDAGALNDMWEWDGTTWTALPISPQSPQPRHHHAMTYDAKRDTLVLFGGDDRAGHPLQDTWLFRYDGPAAPPETCATCTAGCGACRTCGDFHCDPGESCSSCPGDCGSCP